MNEDPEAIREVWRPVIRYGLVNVYNYGLVNVYNQHLQFGAPQASNEEINRRIDDATEELLRGMFPDKDAKNSHPCELTAEESK
jgi:hypothetical protein